tara:strand:- start:401 stop:892 length:492 start_codon:yes stop_codon:yes gene_type:complete
MAGFKFKKLVKSTYEAETSSSYPSINRSDILQNWEDAALDLAEDLAGKTGISVGVPSQSSSTLTSLGMPTNLKNALMSDNMIFIHNGRTSPYWVVKNRLVVFNGSGTSGNTPDNETARAQGDVAYDALKLKAAYLQAVSAQRTGTGSDAETLGSAYTSKLAQV